MKKNRWLAVVFAGVFLILAAVIFLHRDRFFPDERVATREMPEAVSVVSEKDKKYDEKSVRKKIMPPGPKEEVAEPADVEKGEQDQLQERVEQFFDYLDRQDYINARKLEEGSYRHFLGLISKLSSRPPVVSGEMKDIYTLRYNMAHFYRVMGKNDLFLIKDILSNERKMIEPVMEMLYEWGLRETEDKSGKIEACAGDLYEYAAFFLSTVAGKAYLLRRESGTRMLLTYYSILTLDMANRKNLNRYGVDIIPHVNLLIGDISRYSGLDHKDKYLERLYSIRN
ncbi:MAG: hypothetical protein U9N38_06000 [Thermodesulfobacteriota bacterium]|nr:hypothetical protein [Thermodesulfobacteriota bacterium]